MLLASGVAAAFVFLVAPSGALKEGECEVCLSFLERFYNSLTEQEDRQSDCDLKYDKQVDLSTVDLKKLRVKELKKILEEWGESCKGCAEESDFIRKITDLVPKYAPLAAKSRSEL
ncbi:hypothetical protein scyTo_0023809 [Scyliorhinus torazame]|uniref:ARMET C-terminal domain-containing protein n=1 Tax=Scyliorhinus torazame TaxID=75743 RepID=A0A401QCI4_SCYTO|nr:hypothetical protein [Scyliorhinus torazame]